ncbi:peptide chain release factor N(5)-glutamine methyltransferase [Sulfobacillus harzensis]|uniref:Release factor glutamine methyltransferase n=1 Tax=Sulfobacillus harzensis TaxID=2729629 RepID=A0A7Y0Q0G9_9FIRM|nr:peptide chain release factor N(5)-glutamine methyltransferase [Sulfobacillus harzensis]NMP21018.1 peptide chain release factor N(5)-glutamine methyltransferase [Sulfobacillus harzensis]
MDAWRQHLQEAAEQLRAAGIDRAEREARYLLEWASGRTLADWVAHGGAWDDTLDARFGVALRRRSEREPLAYITGQREFYGLMLRVTPAVLIPRPETEGLVQAVLDMIHQSQVRVVDVGTGSGAVALALKANKPAWTVYGVDRSADALRIAKDNARALNLSVRFFRSDLLREASGPFDVVVANLPYVPDGYRGDEELSHEPPEALYGGPDGLSAIRALIGQARLKLSPWGWIFLECGIGQAKTLGDYLRANGFDAIKAFSDLAGIPRVVAAQVRSEG